MVHGGFARSARTGLYIPFDALILAVPVAYAAAALGTMVYKTLAYDPEQTNASSYADEAKVRARADSYQGATTRFFQPRITGHESWSVPLWSNEAAVTHPHS